MTHESKMHTQVTRNFHKSSQTQVRSIPNGTKPIQFWHL